MLTTQRKISYFLTDFLSSFVTSRLGSNLLLTLQMIQKRAAGRLLIALLVHIVQRDSLSTLNSLGMSERTREKSHSPVLSANTSAVENQTWKGTVFWNIIWPKKNIWLKSIVFMLELLDKPNPCPLKVRLAFRGDYCDFLQNSWHISCDLVP